MDDAAMATFILTKSSRQLLFKRRYVTFRSQATCVVPGIQQVAAPGAHKLPSDMWQSVTILMFLMWTHGSVSFSFSDSVGSKWTTGSHSTTFTKSMVRQKIILWSTTKESTDKTYNPIFDFGDPSKNAVEKFERIDDAIMGGISLSSLKQSDGENFARWSGICRIDGGGFCGTRTLPFTEPIQVGKETDGLYIMCRLTSDDEPERRVWKVTTRSEQSRGEQLYQAMFELPAKKAEWTRIEIPFSSFVQVRGPRIVDGAPSLNVTKGIYQIGISLSKFMLSKNVTEIANFRPGFFELQIKEIGIYLKGEDEVSVTIPATLTETEAANNRPILLKLLLPLAKMFFDEKSRRRASAMRILQKRGLSITQARLFGFKIRAKQHGFIAAIAQSIGIVCQDILKASLYWTFRLTLVFPILILSRAWRFMSKELSPSEWKDRSSESIGSK